MTVSSPHAENGIQSVLATAVATPVRDVESLKIKHKPDDTVTVYSPTIVVDNSHDDENDGKGLGIAMFVLLLVGFIFNFINPIVSFVCVVATVVIASILQCGCCCASSYRMKPNVKRFAVATLASLFLSFVVQIVGVASAVGAMGSEVSNRGTLSEETAQGAGLGILIAWLLGLVLNIIAIVFSALFTWGRGCCAPHSIDPIAL